MKNYRSIPATPHTMPFKSLLKAVFTLIVSVSCTVSALHAGAVGGTDRSVVPVITASRTNPDVFDPKTAYAILSSIRQSLFISSESAGKPKSMIETFFGGAVNTVDRKPDTTVTLVDPSAPSKAFVEQNAPNPANDVTTIRYGLPGQTWVKISIHTMLGNTVKTIVNEPQRAGTYTIQFNVADLQPGLYFYRLHTEYGVSTRRMTISS